MEEEGRAGRDPTVAQLAAEVSKKDGKKSIFSRFVIPVGGLAITILLINVLAVVLPMALILTQAADRGMRELVDMTLANAAGAAMRGVQGFLDEPARVENALFGSNWAMQNDIVAIKPPITMRNSSRLVANVYAAVSTAQYITSVFCLCPDLANASALIDQPASVWQNNYLLFGFVPGPMWFQYIDWNEVNDGVFVQPPLGRVNFSEPHPLAKEMGFPPLDRSQRPFDGNPMWVRLLLPDPPKDGFWGMINIPGAGIGMQYTRIRYDLTTGKPLFICTHGQFIDVTITPFLINLKPTPNTVTMLVDGSDLLVSASVDKAAANAVERFKADASPDPVVAGIGKAILAKVGSFAAMPKGWSSTIVVNGVTYFLQTDSLTISPMNLTLVVAIPRSDFFANIDSANKRSAIVTACVAVVVTTLGVVALTLMVRPLRTLTSGMEQITKFDFSILNTGILKHRSPVKEFREMETVFDTMCKAFASAIRRNRSLVSGTQQQSSTGHVDQHKTVV